MRTGAVVYDSGAIDRSFRDPELRATVRALVEAGWVPLLPTVVLAEALGGGPTDALVNQVIKRTGTEGTGLATARLAGGLRARAQRAGRRRVSGIDAIVAAHATTAERAVVLTTDPGDLEALLVEAPQAVVLPV